MKAAGAARREEPEAHRSSSAPLGGDDEMGRTRPESGCYVQRKLEHAAEAEKPAIVLCDTRALKSTARGSRTSSSA
jgi:hypothetical protein